MNYKLLLAAFATVLGLTACGGGGGSSSSTDTSTSSASNPAALSYTDTTVGTGDTLASGLVATTSYTVWLYTSTGDHKGTQIQTGSFFYQVGAGSVITGFEQGMAGMKVGGSRSILIPSSLAYGSSGSGSIPANAGLVYEVSLTALQAVSTPSALKATDTTVGTGAVATSGKTLAGTYTLWLYNDKATDFKGPQVGSYSFSFVAGTGATYTSTSTAVILGLDQGVIGTTGVSAMAVGGKRTLLVPASLAYGSIGASPVPPNSGLVYEISLTSVQ